MCWRPAWDGLTRAGSNRPVLLSSLFLRTSAGFPRTFFRYSTSKRRGERSQDGAGRSSSTPLATLSAVARRGLRTPDSGCSRGEAAVDWSLLFLPPPPWLGNDPISSSHLGFGSLGVACLGPPASPAQPAGTLRVPPLLPCLPSAQLQHRGAASAAPENQDDNSGVLQPHQLDSDSNLRLPYLGLFRPRVQHRGILRGSETGLFISPGLNCLSFMHSAIPR